MSRAYEEWQHDELRKEAKLRELPASLDLALVMLSDLQADVLQAREAASSARQDLRKMRRRQVWLAIAAAALGAALRPVAETMAKRILGS